MPITEYQKSVIAARQRAFKLMVEEERLLLKYLRQARNELSSLVSDIAITDGTIPFHVWRKKAVQAELDRIISEMSAKVNLGMQKRMTEVAGETAMSMESTTRSLLARQESEIIASFSHVSMEAVQATMARSGLDGLKLSDRVWRFDDTAKRGINQIVNAGIAEGRSAVELSKDVKQYLLEPDLSKHPEWRWTTRITKSVSGRGTIHYQALRLARTEINNAYFEARVRSAKASPVVESVKWILSGSHPIPDECDMLAETDFYGMGSGVYPLDSVPLLPHPHCLCDTLDNVRSEDDWGTPKMGGDFSMPSVEKLEKKYPKVKYMDRVADRLEGQLKTVVGI